MTFSAATELKSALHAGHSSTRKLQGSRQQICGTWLVVIYFYRLLANHSAPFSEKFAFHYCIVFTKICIAVSQADARNYCFMYTISVIKRREKCLRHWTTQRRRIRGKLMSFTFFPFPSHPFVPKKKNCYRSGRYLAPRPIHFWRWVNAIKLSHFFFKILRYILCMANPFILLWNSTVI